MSQCALICRSQNVGYADYYKWKKVWSASARGSASARSDPLITTFIGDEVLPYWIQCTRCSRWREMGRYFSLSKELTEQFVCMISCDEQEDVVGCGTLYCVLCVTVSACLQPAKRDCTFYQFCLYVDLANFILTCIF